MSKLCPDYDLYCKLSSLLSHQCSEQKWLSGADEGTKSSLLLMFEVLTAPGAARTTPVRGAALSMKLMESLLCPPSKEMVPQHMLTSQWIQTEHAVKKKASVHR